MYIHQLFRVRVRVSKAWWEIQNWPISSLLVTSITCVNERQFFSFFFEPLKHGLKEERVFLPEVEVDGSISGEMLRRSKQTNKQATLTRGWSKEKRMSYNFFFPLDTSHVHSTTRSRRRLTLAGLAALPAEAAVWIWAVATVALLSEWRPGGWTATGWVPTGFCVYWEI